MKKHIIGIDPGLSGGIAVVDSNGEVVSVTKMPGTPQDILDHLRGVVSEATSSHALYVCYMEKVGTGRPGQSSRATATFAHHYGNLEMALLAIGIPTNVVTPNKWEKAYQLGNSSECTRTVWKNRLKARAQQIFPMLGRKITLATCDALLLAEYGRIKELKGE